MPKHLCIDPLDSYAEREVLVAFEAAGSSFHRTAAIDRDGQDILSELTEAQRKDIQDALIEACGFGVSTTHPASRGRIEREAVFH
ncbi:hypothetical protein [Methylobacterium sp. PvR107]|uniref:hypothetical protein n=1 Tax=Methylobacterium sp. PvR107 TaxID=2806597 RepID=UPI001AE70D92|nr:hypothetical protein [Methylobacterium sp. PvR107]MBP1181063.1 hypothetical protein [Methylobacterium sp. PvR107]